MKKAINIFVSLILLSATFGVTVSKHYCMGRLKAQWLGHEQHEVCAGMESMADMEGCCSNETETFVMDEDFSVVSFDFQATTTFDFLYLTYQTAELEIGTGLVSNTYNPQNTGPPFVEPEIFVQVQSFLL